MADRSPYVGCLTLSVCLCKCLVIRQIGGLDIQSTRNAYGRQINSFECVLKLQDPALFHNGHTHTPYAHDEFLGIFIRAPGIVSLNSPHVQPLATLEDGNGARSVVAVRQGQLLGTCFHPELTSDPRWHSYFLDMVISQKYPQQ